MINGPREAALGAAIFHGAFGAIRRDSTPAQLFSAIRSVARGEPWLAAGILPFRLPQQPLTRRERGVAALIGRGCSNKEIADELGICVARDPYLFEDGTL